MFLMLNIYQVVAQKLNYTYKVIRNHIRKNWIKYISVSEEFFPLCLFRGGINIFITYKDELYFQTKINIALHFVNDICQHIHLDSVSAFFRTHCQKVYLFLIRYRYKGVVKIKNLKFCFILVFIMWQIIIFNAWRT